MLGQRFGSGRATPDVLTDHSQRLLKSLVPGPLNEQIPHAKHWKTSLHQGQELLIEDQKLSQGEPRKGTDSKHRPACCRSAPLEFEDQQTLALEFGANEGLLIAFNLALECRSIWTGDSVRKYSHGYGPL